MMSSPILLMVTEFFVILKVVEIRSCSLHAPQQHQLLWVSWLDGKFPPWTRNYFASDGPRTNNHLEGWHNRVKLISTRAHPHLWEFIELVQKEQASTDVTIEQVAAGGRRRAKRRKVVQHEKQIKRLTDEFWDGDRCLDSLLNSMSHCVVSFDY